MTQRELVIVHGWAFGSSIFEPILGELSRHYTVRVIELPGYGANRNLSVNGEDLVDWLHNNTPADAVWLGWSLGASLSLKLAVHRPTHIRQLICLSATPRFCNSDDWSFGVPVEVVDEFIQLCDTSREALLRRFFAMSMSPGRAPQAIRHFLNVAQGESGVSSQALVRDLKVLRETDLRGDLEGFGTPLCLLHGTSDQVIPLQAARWIGDRVPTAEFYTVSNSGHAWFYTEPETCINLLIENILT